MKNKIGGSGAKKAKNFSQSSRQLQFKEELQDYALVTTILGSGRMKLLCLFDRKERIGTIRGSMYKKVWVAKDDIVLISLREYQDDRCDIILKYTQDEVRALQNYEEIPTNIRDKTELGIDVEDDTVIEFGGDDFIDSI
jgi:translation initiation factor 1A